MHATCKNSRQDDHAHSYTTTETMTCSCSIKSPDVLGNAAHGGATPPIVQLRKRRFVAMCCAYPSIDAGLLSVLFLAVPSGV
eukprot:3041234-Amphidinium_carterae.1